MIVKANGDVDIIDRVVMKYINDFHILTPNQKIQAVYNLSKDTRYSIDTETFNKMFNKTQQRRYFTNLLNYKGVGKNQLWFEAFDQTRGNILNIETLYDLALENFYIEQQDFFTTTGHVLNEDFYINLGYFKGVINIDHTPITISCHMMDEYIQSSISDTLMDELDKFSFFKRDLKIIKRKELTKSLSPVRIENKIDHFEDKKKEIVILFRNAESLKNVTIENFYNDCLNINNEYDIQQYLEENINYYKNKLTEIVSQ